MSVFDVEQAHAEARRRRRLDPSWDGGYVTVGADGAVSFWLLAGAHNARLLRVERLPDLVEVTPVKPRAKRAK